MLPRQYDYVLASHSISYLRGILEPMVVGAWDAIAPGGTLTVVDSRDNGLSDWRKLMNRVGLVYGLRFPDGYDRLVRLLSYLGNMEEVTFVNHVKANTAEEMITALSFIGSSGFEEYHRKFMKQAPLITEILNNEYRDGDSYAFPIPQHFLKTKKAT